MKKLIFGFAAIFMLAFSANKQGLSGKELAKDIKKIDPNSCVYCENIKKLTATLRGLDYSKEEDRYKGSETVIGAVEKLKSFKELDKRNPKRQEAFEDSIELVLLGGPFDGESQLAQVFSEFIETEKELNAAYEKQLKQLESKATETLAKCRVQRIKTSVSEILCLEKAGTKGADSGDKTKEREAKKCIQKFNFEQCLEKKK